jgi:hypothetical protein
VDTIEWPYGWASDALRAWKNEVDDTEEVCAYCGEPLVADEMNCPGCGITATKLTEEDWRNE